MVIVPILPHSVVRELEHPNTPLDIKRMALGFVYTKEVSLTSEQEKKLRTIASIIVGKGNRKKHQNDALHIFISEDSGEYFITTDERLIKKRDEIKNIGIDIKICRPTEFVKKVEEDRQFQIEHRKRMDKLRGTCNK